MTEALPDDQDENHSRRGRPRQGRAVARHLPRDEEILKISAEVFFHQGFAGTKLEDIAREAGIVKGSLYHYFESKEQIYERLISDIVDLLETEETVARDAGPLERLATYVRRRVRMVAENPVEVGILGRQLVHIEGDIGDWARDYRRRNIQYIRKVIIEGQRAGIFRPGDPDVLATFILGTITVLPEWYRPGGRLDVDEIVEEMASFILWGVGAVGESGRATKRRRAPRSPHP